MVCVGDPGRRDPPHRSCRIASRTRPQRRAQSEAEAAMSFAAEPLLRIESLTVRLPKGADRAHAVRALELEARANEILCIVGESGSGKSMAANAIMRLLPPGVHVESGRIVFDGRDLLSVSEVEMQEIR